ncbi:NAD(P)-binding protein [Rhizodiscina lignyota]|uniref:NAD(P)-binding protein n=1 Tax=Rhizodiscina lignyota TaxID=1504668 RepID=A0A9P4M999_9PEZI|nr:NAD(P)-binding protein [Rhizodiscina lignyota]
MTESKTNILITGAASGIGLCFLEHFRRQANTWTIAVDRMEIPISRTLDDSWMSVHADLTDEISLRNVMREIGDIPIHLVIHSAGIRGLMPPVSEVNDVPSRETWQAITTSKLVETFNINTAATFSLLKMLMGRLIWAGTNDVWMADENGHPTARCPWVFAPKVVIMTSRMGSVSYNSVGGAYAYRASKAALNAIVKSFSIDMPEILFALVHPGRVETGLVEFKEERAMGAEESVGDMLKLIERLELKDSGRFMDRFGEDIGW